MAAVYAATHRNRKRFAVKMLHVELSVHPEIRERFLREGYVANTVDHPGALAVLDDDVSDDGSAFLVMELLEGTTVEQMIERAPVDPRLTLSLTSQLLSVLEAAHAHGIVHRDIKPANLFVVGGGTLKVLDFGIARLRDATAAGATATGAVMGTPAFMPPEQVLGKSNEIDHQSDIWAVGATMFSMLTTRMVHEGETVSAIMVNAATKAAPKLGDVLPAADAGLAAIVDRALAFARAERFSSAREMREAVDGLHRALYAVDPPQPHYEARARAPSDPDATSSPAPEAAPSSGSGARPSGPGPGRSTTGALSFSPAVGAHSGPRPPHEVRRVPVPAIAAGAVVAVALLGAAVVYGVRASKEKEPPAPAALVAPSHEAAPAPPIASLAIAPLAPPPAFTANPGAPSPAASAESSAGHVTPAAKGGAPRAGKSGVVPSAPVAPASTSSTDHGGAAAASAKTAPTKPALPNCDPPYVLDANGKRTYKKECL